MVKVERIENRQLLLAATDSALLNVIDYKLKHNKYDMMTLRYSSDDQKCEQQKNKQNKTRSESRLQQKRMSDQHPQSIDRWIEIFRFNYLRMSGKIVVART